MNSAKEVFTNIFTNKIWGETETVSGEGSRDYYSKAFAERFEILLKGLKIKTMVDAPCGDGNFINNVNIKGIKYYGYDVVSEVIEINKKRFKNRKTMSHEAADVITADLPNVDLIFCRDLLIHLPNDLILKLLHNLKRSGSKWLMTTHFHETARWATHINGYMNIGDWHPVNLCHPPFNLPQPILTVPEYDTGKAMALWDLQSLQLPLLTPPPPAR